MCSLPKVDNIAEIANTNCLLLFAILSYHFDYLIELITIDVKPAL